MSFFFSLHVLKNGGKKLYCKLRPHLGILEGGPEKGVAKIGGILNIWVIWLVVILVGFVCFLPRSKILGLFFFFFLLNLGENRGGRGVYMRICLFTPLTSPR